MDTDDDWPAVVENLIKASKNWARLSRILGWKGADVRTSVLFYKAVFQEIFLFG